MLDRLAGKAGLSLRVMDRVTLAGTTLEISPLCLGGAPFGAPLSDAESFALLDHFVELGGNFIDTARIYSDWIPGEKRRSERVLGDWLQARRTRDGLVIATKGAHPDLDRASSPRTSAADLRSDLEGSLQKLRIETIDLYWLHRDDPTRPVEHFVDTLNVFLREGKIRAWGVSNWTTPRLRAAHDYAQRSGQLCFVANQPFWCLGHLQAKPPGFDGWVKLDAAMHAFHAETGIAVIPYTAQAKGFFTKLNLPFWKRPLELARHEFHTPANVALGRVVAEIAGARGVTSNAVVLAYLWTRAFPVVPIIGASRPVQLDDNFAALGFRLTPAEMRALETASCSGL
ncbi:MAG: aldo/keto reductase [Opitutus sp.]|nr:aldo/keto reductase [Opitutus sp.]